MHAVCIAGRVIAPGAPVLQHERNFGLAGRQVECRAKFFLIGIRDLEQAEHAAVGLAGGQAVRVGVVPVQRAAIEHVETIGIALARRSEHRTRTVVARVDREPVPVHDRRFADGIDELHARALSGTQHERRVHVIAPAKACDISLREARWSAVAGFERRSPQRQRLLAEDKAPQEAALARNEQRLARITAATPITPR